MQELYCGIDLHSNNGYLGIVEKSGTRRYSKRHKNSLSEILTALSPYEKQIKKIAIESTYNWYWLVDGLMENGYKDKVELANPPAMQQYNGLKNANDKSDAFFLTEQLCLGILPTGTIYPKDERPLRDMLRRRMMFVQQRTSQILSLQSLITRQSGCQLSMTKINKLYPIGIDVFLKDKDSIFMANQNMEMIRLFSQKIMILENYISDKIKLKPEFEKLTSIPGIGIILGMTIMLETGDIRRFKKPGDYTSYCRCVKAGHYSNDKKKGNNNKKNGNKYLSWAFTEAAHTFVRYCPEAQSFYHKKKAAACGALATKALASKLSKAAYFIMRDQVIFDKKKIFG
jgi:transposase